MCVTAAWLVSHSNNNEGGRVFVNGQVTLKGKKVLSGCVCVLDKEKKFVYLCCNQV